MVMKLHCHSMVPVSYTHLEEDIPAHSRMVTRDDVFDYMLNLRELNTHIDQEREKLFQEHTQARHTVFPVSYTHLPPMARSWKSWVRSSPPLAKRCITVARSSSASLSPR